MSSTRLASGSEVGGAPGKKSDLNQADKDRKHKKENEQQTDSLEEIIVTAQKRSENLLDVPTSVSAIGGERLESLQVNSLSNLANYVPGLSVTDGGAPGTRLIEIRGLSTTYYPTSGPLVGTYIDDLPVGDSTNNARGALFGLDLNPYDIDHVEVLKGPQGTLYGANTMGGLIKYSLRSPNLEQVEVLAGADGGYIDGSNGANWGIRGAVNLPIVTDKLAVRLSGFHRYTAGYIDNVITGAKYVNHSTESGGRGALLWQVTDSLAVRAMILAQNVNAADLTAVTFNNGATLQPLNGPFRVSSYFSEPSTQQSRIYSIGVDWNLHFATLSSSTGWSRINSSQTQDFTSAFGAFCVPNFADIGLPGCPNYPHADALVPFYLSLRASKLVEEVRLTSPENQRMQWMLGGYYTKEDTWQNEFSPALTPSYVPADLIFQQINTGVYRERAGFANITYKFNDRFDIGGGDRYSAYSQTGCPNTVYGLFGSPYAPCTSLPSTGVSVWMANARFHLNQDAMLYARVATGYRPGGGCPTCGQPALGVPGVVNPDKTTNYEVGFKGSLLDQRLQVEMAAFHIDWKDVQLTQITAQGLLYPGNGGTAVSNGFELTTAYRVMKDLRLNATLGYTDAHLTQDAPAAGGKSGDPLPGSPRWTGSLTADYSRPLDDRKTLLLGAGYRYKDAVVNQLEHTGDPFPLGPQNIADVYTGLTLRDVTIRLYATNVFNNRSYVGLLYVDDPTRPVFVPLKPRTIGLSVDYQLK
jgi:outer membrane receptor protein involved in Fe transport